MSFPFFVMKKAPVSGVESLMNYQGQPDWRTAERPHRDVGSVIVPVTSPLPVLQRRSRKYGAHNQRSP